MIKWDLFQGCKDGPIFANQSVWYTTLRKRRVKKSCDHLNRCRKSIWQNSTSIHDKNSHQSEYRGNISQHNKDHLWQTHGWHHIQQWKAESLSSKVRNKTRMPTLATSVYHIIGNASHSHQTRKRNKRHPNWKGRTNIVTICRWHDTISRKP